MLESAGLDKVWFVVSPQNPFKKEKDLLHAFDRFDLVERAIADNGKLKASDVEFHFPKPNYTIHTLSRLKSLHPGTSFCLLLGEDNLVSFPKWNHFEDILADFELIVYPRPNSPKTPLHEHPKVTLVDAPLIDISASYIRKCIKSGKSIRYIVPEPVEALIQLKKFYI